MSFIIKLKKAKAPTRLAYFDVQPSWRDLASKIVGLYNVSSKNVSVTFFDKAKDKVTIASEEELQHFYERYSQSSKEIKFVVQDLRFPDSELASTWSADSNLSGLSGDDDQLTLFCWVLNVSDTPFPVDIGKSMTVGHLKEAIRKDNEPAFDGIEPDTLELWKLSPSIPSAEIHTKLKGIQSPQQIQDSDKLNPLDKLSEHFPSPAGKHLHIIVEVPPTPSRKHPRSLSAQGDDKAKKKRATSHPSNKTWSVNGGITVDEANELYYVDPGTQEETKLCLNAVEKGTYLLLAGARASGKTTRLHWLWQKLKADYCALYISFDRLDYRGSTEQFWESFGNVIETKCRLGLPKISSRSGFISYFYNDSWDRKVVLLLDEFSSLYQANDDVRDDFFEAFRGLKQDRQSHALQCIIAAGIYSIVYLNPSNSGVSPFNIADIVQSPYFTFDEISKLFHEFAQDLGYSIDDAIAEDLWAKSNGHPGMVCLCGRTIFKNIHTLICRESRTISYNLWKQFPVEKLYGEISLYSTFYSMIQSLSRAEASSVDLLRSRFTGFLGDVTLTDEKAKKDADTLTSEGVLLKPDPATGCYRMASPLVDALIRNQLIPAMFPNAPSSPLPLQPTGHVDVLGVLIESLKFFDKALILNASSCSCKKPKIPSLHGLHVPRESVYDTELMRILANWLRKRHWSVNSQWHSENNLERHKYSDIVLKKESRTIVLELLATGEPSSVESHIRKTPEYAALVSANEAWVVHFTRQEDYQPIWQSDMSVNVVHFAHDPGFTKVVMSARWKNCAGEVQQEVGKSLLLN